MKSKKAVRKIGAEILEGIREIKRGEIGRVVPYPPIDKESQSERPQPGRKAFTA
jgi:hypothetical protein